MQYNVKNIEGTIKQETKKQCKNKRAVFSKKQQTMFGFLFVFILSFNIFNLGVNLSGVSNFAKKIISSYAGGDQIGKIKYVDSTSGENTSMVFSFFDIDYMLPFKNGAVSQTEDGRIFINGGSDCLVVCPYKSTVKEILNEGLKKTVVLDCGFSVNMFLINLDNVGVKVGQSLNKGDKIGLCFDSILETKITFRGKTYDKIRVVDGKLSLK